MFLLYFALWVILNGRWTLEIGVFGLVFAALMYVFSCRFMGMSVKRDLALARRLGFALRYGVLLLEEIVKANLAVMRMILTRGFEPKPQLVTFHGGLNKERHRVVLADSITLTPGTITCMLDADLYTVHCLDESLVDGLDDGVLIRSLRAQEEKDQREAENAPAAKRGKGKKEEGHDAD